MYKLSNYNFIEEYPEENCFILFNSLSAGILKIPKDEYYKIQEIFQNMETDEIPKNQELFLRLFNGRFIVEKDQDEIEYIKFKQQNVAFNKHQLTLTICPTLECNLKCIYCYENQKKGMMTEKEINSIKLLVEKKSDIINNLNIIWYGGEPLLCHSLINELSKHFIKICNEKNIKYNSSILTNGTLLNNLEDRFFEKNKISSVQITIDGDQSLHDKMRPMKNGNSSFEEILNGLRNIKNQSVNIGIRMNIDKKNYYKIDKLTSSIMLIKDSFKGNLGVYFSKIGSGKSGEGCLYKNNCLTDREFAEIQIKLIKEICIKKSINYLLPLKQSKSVCYLPSISSFVVDPKCDLYKCWEHVGIYQYKVGIINLQGDIEIRNNPFFIKCSLFDATEYEKCKVCKVLPICLGGCPMKFFEKGSTTEPECQAIKYNIKDRIKIEYDLVKN